MSTADNWADKWVDIYYSADGLSFSGCDYGVSFDCSTVVLDVVTCPVINQIVSREICKKLCGKRKCVNKENK